jgi:hypothetical protein
VEPQRVKNSIVQTVPQLDFWKGTTFWSKAYKKACIDVLAWDLETDLKYLNYKISLKR